MIVPLELSILGSRKGYVSPELALGWRIGGRAREVFCGLDCIHMASRRPGDSALALSEMVSKQFVFSEVKVVSGSRPWDFLCYHPQTGTTLAYGAIEESTTLPKAVSALEAYLHAGDISVVIAYQKAVDYLIRMIVALPFEKLCTISERRVRRLVHGSETRRRHCPRCGLLLEDGVLWDVEGAVCCSSCCGLEESWITYH